MDKKRRSLRGRLQGIGDDLRSALEAERKPIEVEVIDVPWSSPEYTRDEISTFRQAVALRQQEVRVTSSGRELV